jgi:hypothetical protein
LIRISRAEFRRLAANVRTAWNWGSEKQKLGEMDCGALSMHSVKQNILDVSHRIANIEARSQQASDVGLRQASLLRRLLQSLYRNKDGYSVLVLHDLNPPFAGLC